MKKSTPKKTVKSAKKSVKKATRPAVKPAAKKVVSVQSPKSSSLSPFQILLWLSIIFSSILIIVSKL
ncbi:hypothetical protein HYV64_01220 [Candidatus Shapirobacteria bacterium]|nr:hypothetical protein [Candidatus Shapirobacteria bacterium]